MGARSCRGTKFAQPSWLQQAILGSWPCRICAWATTHYLRQAHHWPSSVICADQQGSSQHRARAAERAMPGVTGGSYE